MKVDVYNQKGEVTGSTVLPKEIFEVPMNADLVHQVLISHTANQRQNSAHTKNRGEVRGGGKKPWRQKGTGNARAGSSRSPIWVGGGKALGPRFRNPHLSLPKKMKKQALSQALSEKLRSGQIMVITNIEKAQPKTKSIVNLLSKLDTKGSTVFVIAEKIENLKLASRNIPKVSIEMAQDLNAYKVTNSNNLLLSKEAIAKFQ